MNAFNVPTREQVTPANQAVFDQIKSKLGMVPNLYATFALSETALPTYLALQNAKSSISGKAREVVNLVVSQFNECAYCLAAHTVVGKMVGFTEAQVLEIRTGHAAFNTRLDILARLIRNIVARRGHSDATLVSEFLAAGWTQENLVDVIMTIGDKIISNYLHSTTEIPVDFPSAPALT